MSWSRNGLVRKSMAPAFIARTDIGMSPCPVMKTIGIPIPAPAELRLEIEAAHAWQPDIQDEAARNLRQLRFHEFGGRTEDADRKSDRAEQVAQRIAQISVVIDDIDDHLR